MAFDTKRLYSILATSQLQRENEPLYQVIYQLIGALGSLVGTVGNISSTPSSGGDTIQNILQILSGDGDGSGGGDGLVIPGEKGIQGITGDQGPVGPVVFIEDGIDGLDGQSIPVQGPQGIIGETGSIGPPVFMAEDYIEPDIMPTPGPQGISGVRGNDGPPVFMVEDYIEPDVMPIPGPKGDTGSGGGGGGLVYLGTQTTAGATVLDFTSLISSTYNKYIFEFENIIGATDNVDLLMRTSTDNGATFSAGVSDYGYANYINNTGAFSTNTVCSAADSSIQIFPDMDFGSTTGGINGSLSLFNPLNSAQYKSCSYHVNGFINDGQFYNCVGSGWRLATADVDAIRFLMSSGNIIGTIRMYGVVKT